MQPNWQNRTMWTGDNLDIMRGMNSASVDLIYLDPPFNSNRTYSAPIGSEAAGAAFKDTWTLSDVDEAWHGEVADREPTIYAAIDAAGLTHGNWSGRATKGSSWAGRWCSLFRTIISNPRSPIRMRRSFSSACSLSPAAMSTATTPRD